MIADCRLRIRRFQISDFRLQIAKHSKGRGGFTMIEIAICIAVIGFALVAIVGVLPMAMRVQQDNRSDTIIDQDGNYFLEAIRHGAQGVEDLPNYVNASAPGNPHGSVRLVHYDQATGNYLTNVSPGTDPLDPKIYNSGRKLIGLLSIPRTNDNGFRVEADFYAISGAAVEKDPSVFVAFKYMLVSEVIPFSTFNGTTAFGPANSSVANALPNMATTLNNNLYELRLTFRWPLLRNGAVGSNKKVFRTMVSGNLVNEAEPNWNWYFYFQSTNLLANQVP